MYKGSGREPGADQVVHSRIHNFFPGGPKDIYVCRLWVGGGCQGPFSVILQHKFKIYRYSW